MKKALSLLLIGAMTAGLLSVSASAMTRAELSNYGQNTYTIYEVGSKAPIPDGVVTDGEYGDPVQVITDTLDKKACYIALDGDSDVYANRAIHDSSTLYMTYDDSYIYVAFVIEDDSHCCPKDGIDIWEGDYMELDFMPIDTEVNSSTRTRLALGLSDSGNAHAYYAGNPDYLAGITPYKGDELIKEADYFAVTHTDGITTYEVKLPWEHTLGTKPESFLSYAQLGVAHKDLTEFSQYAAYLGAWRNIISMTDAQRAAIANNTGYSIDDIDGRVFNIIVLGGTAPASGTATTPGTTTDPGTTTTPDTFDPAIIAVVLTAISGAALVVVSKKH